MTPRVFRPQLVQAKLRLLQRLLQELAGLGQLTRDRLEAEPVVRLALERLLTQLVDVAVSVNTHVATAILSRAPASYHESFLLAAQSGAIPDALAEQLAPSAGLRSRLVHQYDTIDLDVVAAASAQALSDYRAYLRAVARFLAARGD